MTDYDQLKENIKTILLESPENLVDEFTGELLLCEDWESVEPRIFEEIETTEIGANNIVQAEEKVLDICTPYIKEYYKQEIMTPTIQTEIEEAVGNIFSRIITELVSEHVIRQTPASKRANLQVIDGRDKEERT